MININKTTGDRSQSGDKVARYKWKKLGKPGRYMPLSKSLLDIDHSYQRDRINNERVLTIAQELDWVKFGVLAVAKRGLKYMVLDGQHRLLGALKRSDIEEVPCMIFDLPSVAEEAMSFVALNSHKTAVTAVDRFKAMVVAQDESAVGLQHMLDMTGRKVGTWQTGGCVSCVLTLWQMFKEDRDKLSRIWEMLVDMCPEEPIIDCVVKGIWGVETILNKTGKTITEKPYRAKLMEIRGSGLAAEIRREVAIIGKGGRRVETGAVIKWINRQRIARAAKITIPN